jgi:electron transport complex protein RnfB
MGSLADAIDALLPQTQCTRCGYAACRPYAEALAEGREDLNRCPPGGAVTIQALSALLQRPALPLDEDCGIERGVARVARVIEADCIGCTKCIQVCPADAIVGAANLMHTVIAAQCSGCDLCVPACPVDCIAMDDRPALPLPRERKDEFRALYVAREARLARWAGEDAQRRRQRRPDAAPAFDPVAAALERARAKQAG